MNHRALSRPVLAALLTVGLIPWSGTARAQQPPETKKGIYEIEIEWQMSPYGKGVEIVDITETDLGEVPISRDQGKPLNVKTRMHPLSPGVVEFVIRDLPLVVHDPHPPFSIVALGMDGVGGGIDNAGNLSGSLVHVEQMSARVHSLTDLVQVIHYEAALTQTLLKPVGTGVLRLTYTCETCPSNPCALGLD